MSSAADYHADKGSEKPSLSASIATLLCTSSPLHAWIAHPRLNPDYVAEESKIFDIGKAAHALLLEGINIAQVFDLPDWRKEAAREARDMARAAGKIPLLREQWTEIQKMIEAARLQLDAHQQASNMFTDGKPEQDLRWVEDGVFCKARLDWLHDSHRFIDDYKTTSGSANPEAWTRSLFGCGADIQAAFYIRGLKAIDPKADPIFRFAVQETYAPYALSVISLGPDVMMLAEKKIIYAIEQWKKCLETGIWPGYPDRICYANLPGWEEERWLRKEVQDVF